MNNVVHVVFGPSASSLFAKACEIDDYDPKEGIRLYRRAIHLDPSRSDAMTNLGRVYFRLGETGAAINWWERAVRTNPQAADAHYNLGYLRLLKGDYRAAIARFEMAIGIEPGFANAYYNLAEALVKLGRHAEAQACLRTHIKLRGEWTVEARAALGVRLIQGGA
jgi:tetratricopeptide (TPR) repeat protein